MNYDDCHSDDVTIFWLIFLRHFQNLNYNVQQVHWSITSQIENWKKHLFWLTSRTGKKITIKSSNTFLDHLFCWLWRKEWKKNPAFFEDFFLLFYRSIVEKDQRYSWLKCPSDDVTIFWLIFLTHFQNPNYNVQQVRWSITSQIKNRKKHLFWSLFMVD